MKRFNLILAFISTVFFVSHVDAASIETWTLENGAKVFLVENHSLPMIDVSISFDAGSRRDAQGKAGLADLTRQMLLRGSAKTSSSPALSEALISDALMDISARFGGFVNEDLTSVTLRTLSEKQVRDKSIDLVAQIISKPTFPEDILNREKARETAAILENEMKPAIVVDWTFREIIYGKHPYGWRPTASSIKSITRKDIANFHKKHYVTDSAVIAIVGDVSKADAKILAKKLTALLPRASAPLSPLPEIAYENAQEKRIPFVVLQAHVLTGMPALERGDKDFFALSVGNYILGSGSFVSRLMREVREKRGLSYSVRSRFEPMKQKGAFFIGLQTKKEQADEALKVTRKTLNDFLQNGPTDEEMKSAKDYLTGAFPLSIDTNGKMLNNLTTIGYYGLPTNYLDTWIDNIKKVTAEDVRRAFQNKLSSGKMSTVIVGAPKNEKNK